MLGPNSHKLLGEILAELLESESESVVAALYRHLGDILLCFSQGDAAKQTPLSDNLLMSIVDTRKVFEDSPSIGWRLHETILQTYTVFPVVFDSDLVFDHCVQPVHKLLLDVSRGI